MLNFIVNIFIQRSRKLAILTRPEYDRAEMDLVFPLHHKPINHDWFVSSDQIEEIDGLDVKQVVSTAYNEAGEMIAGTRILHGLEKFGIHTLKHLSRFILDDSMKC